MLMCLIQCVCSSIFFRIRGGLRIKGHKLPLCKWWFAIWFACLSCIIRGWDLNFFLIMIIASRMCTQICGWGEAIGCACGISKPNPKRNDYLDFDEFCDNFHIKDWKLVDHPQIYGVVWLTLRGLLLSFLIGLALNSIPFMVCGAPMGLIYWICGYVARKILKKYDKTGWNYGEIAFGFYLGLMNCLGV